MDAGSKAREIKKLRLLAQLAELLVEEQREQGTFQTVPHYSVVERAAHGLGQEVSRAAQGRVMAEIAVLGETRAACPGCGEQQEVTLEKRTAASLDGPVELVEQVAHCPACRRDFFPSA